MRRTASSITPSPFGNANRTSDRVGPFGSAANAEVGIATTPASSGSRSHNAVASSSPNGMPSALRKYVAAEGSTSKPAPRRGPRARPRPPRAAGEPVALGAQCPRQLAGDLVGQRERRGGGVLQRGAAGEREELLDRAQARDQ